MQKQLKPGGVVEGKVVSTKARAPIATIPGTSDVRAQGSSEKDGLFTVSPYTLWHDEKGETVAAFAWTFHRIPEDLQVVCWRSEDGHIQERRNAPIEVFAKPAEDRAGYDIGTRPGQVYFYRLELRRRATWIDRLKAALPFGSDHLEGQWVYLAGTRFQIAVRSDPLAKQEHLETHAIRQERRKVEALRARKEKEKLQKTERDRQEEQLETLRARQDFKTQRADVVAGGARTMILERRQRKEQLDGDVAAGRYSQEEANALLEAWEDEWDR